MDGSDFHARRNEKYKPSDELGNIIVEHLKQSRELLVLCSKNSRNSEWVDREVRWFLENRGAHGIRLAVTEGEDPGTHPEQVFSQTIINAGLHQGRWYDFRGFHGRKARNWKKVRDFDGR